MDKAIYFIAFHLIFPVLPIQVFGILAMMESDEHNNLSPSSSPTNNLCGGGECGVVGGCCSIGNKSPLNYMPFVVKQGSGMWCFADAVEFWWARVFGFFLPCFSPLFGLYERPGAVMLPPPWKNVLFEREGLPSEEPVTVRGIWNAKNIWHTCTFKWLR